MNILVICGSMREHSTTRAALASAAEAAQQAGATVEWLSLREPVLPLCDGRTDDVPAEVEGLRRRVQAADALLIGSPEYHGSLTGALKNALDWLGPDELRNKMVGVLATAHGDAGAMNTLNHLRHVLRWMNAWVLPTQVSIPRAYLRVPEGQPDPELREELGRLGAELVRYSRLLQGGAS